MYLMIYKKSDGTLIYRTSKAKPHYNIGQTTSMGWLVMDIKRLYKGKLLSTYEYDTLVIKHLDFKNKTSLLYKIDMGRVIETIMILLLIYTLFVK